MQIPPIRIHSKQDAGLSSTPRLCLSLSLLLLILLKLLLLLLVLLIILPLQVLNLLLGLWDRFEETLQSCLLAALQILCQPSSTTPNSILTESLLSDQELDQTIDIGSFPFKLAVWVVSRSDVGVEEEFARVGKWPVFWKCVFAFLVSLDPFDELLESTVFAD
jgi:hypothetical protein